MLAAGLDGIERGIEPPPEFHGNAYEATDVPRVPRAMYEAIAACGRATSRGRHSARTSWRTT